MKTEFSFLSNSEDGMETKCKFIIDDEEVDSEIETLVEMFKVFLHSMSYREITTSRIQFLEDDEWKYVLEKYKEWDSEKERIYQNLQRCKGR